MPIYEYACPSCGAEFEKLLFRTAEEVDCPECGAREVKRRLSSFSVGKGASSSPMPDFSGGGCGRCGSTTPGQCNLN